MSMTPLHPLSKKESLNRNEWLELLAYTGLITMTEDSPDMGTLRALEADGLVSIGPLLGVCLTKQ